MTAVIKNDRIFLDEEPSFIDRSQIRPALEEYLNSNGYPEYPSDDWWTNIRVNGDEFDIQVGVVGIDNETGGEPFCEFFLYPVEYDEDGTGHADTSKTLLAGLFVVSLVPTMP